MKKMQSSESAFLPPPRWTKEAAREHNAQMRALQYELQQSLPYQLGSIILHVKHPKRWPQIPAAVRHLLKTVRALRTQNKLPLSPVDLATYARSDRSRTMLQQAKPTGVLRAASEIAQELGYEKAMDFAEKFVPRNMANGVHLLRANMHLENDDAWLSSLNAYLRPFGLAPFELADTPGTRFSRLRATASDVIEGGDMVSVIMPAFNAAATITHAARSILNQTWRNIELIIVDDCSTDNTWEAIQTLAAADPRVKPLRNAANVGPYVSKNLALRIARGKYITGQDADDWSHPERIENDLAIIKESGGSIQAVLSCMLKMTETGEFSSFARMGPSSDDGASRTAAISLLIEAETLKEQLGGWDCVRFGADNELIARVRKIMGPAFQKVHHIGMICLDLATSLSNDPQHGFSKTNGRSKVRQEFLDAYLAWHARITPATARLPFPHVDRKFPAPSVMLVPMESIEINAQAHQAQVIAAASQAQRP